MNAIFTGIGKILAQLEDGRELECYTLLEAECDYEHEYYDIHPDKIGYYDYDYNMNIDLDTLQVKYPNEYGTTPYNINYYDLKIIKIIKVLEKLENIDWSVEL